MLLFCLLLVKFPHLTFACIHFREEFEESFRETGREALMFRDPQDASVVNLILKSGVEGRLPPEMAWVFPLPSKPLEYREADASIFSELDDLARSVDKTRSPVLGTEPRRSIAVHKKEVVGDYELVPIEITDP